MTRPESPQSPILSTQDPEMTTVRLLVRLPKPHNFRTKKNLSPFPTLQFQTKIERFHLAQTTTTPVEWNENVRGKVKREPKDVIPALITDFLPPYPTCFPYQRT
ncbi:hypothetical protein JTE90_008750 [Oedothorax gibbosus]|uniref:Uncharacterized protein n=1 Tax=Oedothorax gibbosus TaxID=931172 RepID=A0AAV6UR73_9ARAC|nr:hypothetical protein JTE90_008750 [Oedothorax gibbosus]